MPYVSLPGSRLHHLVSGSGDQPVLFVHGGFGSSAELWGPTMGGLPPWTTGYAIDNFLRSEAPAGGYGVVPFADRAADFAATLRASPVLVGHSMGGVVSLLAALRHPGQVGGLVLIGTGASVRGHGLARPLLARLRQEGVTRGVLTEISAHWFHRPAPPGFFDAYVERALTAPAQAMIDVQASLIETDLSDRLAEIRIPTLIVHGGRDGGRPLGHAEELHRGIAGSELLVIPDSGHSPMLETAEQFDPMFHDFLRRVAERRASPEPSTAIASST